MIVDIESKLVILGNRKCASSSLYNVFLSKSDIANPLEGVRPGSYESVTYSGKKYILSDLERKFFNRYFKHFTLFQACAFLDRIGFDCCDFKFLLAIRNPYDRCLSEYKYWVRNSPNENELEIRRSTDVNQFILNKRDLFQDSLSYFAKAHPEVEKNVHVVRVESLYDDLINYFSRNHLMSYAETLSAKGEAPIVNASPSESLNLELSPLVKGYISAIFSEDFKVGEYDI